MIILSNFGANKNNKLIPAKKYAVFSTKMMSMVSGLKKQMGILQWPAVPMMQLLKFGK